MTNVHLVSSPCMLILQILSNPPSLHVNPPAIANQKQTQITIRLRDLGERHCCF